MDYTIVLWIVNGLTAISLFLTRSAFMDLKLEQKENRLSIEKTRAEIDHVRETYYKKEDFKEFKEELWRKLDKLEASMEQRLVQSK